jgi:integrase
MVKRDIERLSAPDPSGKQALYWAEGSDHPGLGILVSGTTSAKSWIVQAKLPKTGIARRITLGPVAVLSLDEAWEKARPVLADIHSGIDPKAKKHKPATVREALEQYLANPRLAAKSRRDYRDRVERYLTDWLELPIGSITANMVEARFLAIGGEIEARRAATGLKGGVNVTGAAAANNALSMFRSLWRDQQGRDPDMPTRDPTMLLKRKWHALERRKRVVRPDEMPAFWRAVQGLESRLLRDLATFAMYSGWRDQEVCGLRWAEVDLQEGMLRLPAWRMKARKDFELPMSRQLADLLIARRALGNDGPFVFPGDGATGHTRALAFGLRKVAFVTGRAISPHDLRRTFASVAATCPIPPIALKLLIAHTTGNDVTAGYVVLTNAELRKAAQTVADRIDELCGIAPVEGARFPRRPLRQSTGQKG